MKVRDSETARCFSLPPTAWGRGSTPEVSGPQGAGEPATVFIYSPTLEKSFVPDTLGSAGQARAKALEQEYLDSRGQERRDSATRCTNKGQWKPCLLHKTEAQEHGGSRRGIKAKNCGQGMTSQQSRSVTLSSCLEWDSQEGVSHMVCPGPGASRSGITLS